ncbi:MAG: TM0996/MTH895 family glutaredoxin-like protein [Candidatus Sumerlaeia bacterium]|nr:TM0996/MTH895 family glutaredoxin-like protein [Candidatus Sumerlaeia bacterium]
MKRIQILGTGCPKCQQLVANSQQAVVEAEVEASVEKVTDLQEIMKFGVMMTPALAIDGQVKASGRVLSPEEIKKLIAG